ncbi:MAG: DUF1289 domain-containing protein [Rubritepida sp.]|nr:DUF1289 domain-containing protein [Rubritepida sp.]
MRSPCIQLCQLDPSRRHCIGCGRSLAELEAWPRATEAEQACILEAARKRLAAGR